MQSRKISNAAMIILWCVICLPCTSFAQSPRTPLSLRLKAAPLVCVEAERSTKLASFLLGIPEADNTPQAIFQNLMFSLGRSKTGQFVNELFVISAGLKPMPQPNGHKQRVACVMIPGRGLFAMPRLVLLLDDPEKDLLKTLSARFSGEPEWQSLSARHSGNITVICEGKDIPKISKNAVSPAASRIRDMRKSVPGSFFCWIDVKKTLAVARLFGMSQDVSLWLDETDDCDSLGIGLGFSGKQNSITAALSFKSYNCVLSGLARNVEFHAYAPAPQHNNAVIAEFSTNWPVFYEKIWRLGMRLSPAATKDCRTTWQDLQQMSGIGMERDFFKNLSGSFTIRAEHTGSSTKASLKAEITSPEDLRNGLKRAATWGKWFNTRGLASTYFSTTASTDCFTLNGEHIPNGRTFCIKASDIYIGKSTPSAANFAHTGNSEFLSITQAGNKIIARLEWQNAAPVHKWLDMLQHAAGELSSLSGPATPPKPQAAIALRQLVTAQQSYKTLNLGKYNNLPQNSYLAEFQHLGKLKTKNGQFCSLLMDGICNARPDTGMELNGLIFAPVMQTGTRPVDWREECVFSAVSLGFDGTTPGVYLAFSDGVVYFKAGGQENPKKLPDRDKLAQNGWTKVTHSWR